MGNFDLLPEEITVDIISRVPTESVLECKLVCTAWRNIISYRPSFSKMHLHHQLNHHDSGKMGFIGLTFNREDYQYFEYSKNHESIILVDRFRRFNVNSLFGKDTSILGSCNGLICLYQDRYSLPGKTYICNPITRECVMLPEIKRVGMYAETSGFGYVSSTDEYKVVRVMTLRNETEFVEAYIYTLGSGNGWRNLGKLNFGAYLEEGNFVDGVLYWLDYESETIAPFDLAEEKFCQHLSFPLPPEDYGSADYKLGVLDGCLAFAFNLRVNGADCWNTWLLKKKVHNQALGWSKLINNQDLEASTSYIFVDLEERFIKLIPHKNTFVSLKELGEEDTKMMESVEIEETESLAQPFNQLTLDSYL